MFDIIIIGGGHAGIESININKKKNIKLLLISNNLNNIGALSCNPSIGGIGKGNLVKEIDSLGGIMGYLADNSGIHFKVINNSKGEAVRSTRVQVNRKIYKSFTNKFLKNCFNLSISQETAIKLLIKKNKIIGVKTNMNNIYYSKSIIITTGTFLNGKIYIGLKKYFGGRINEKTKNDLANQLKDIIPYGGRLKTGTPPRISRNNIKFKLLKKQKSDNNPIPYFNKENKKNNIYKQELCWIAKTNKKTHDIIKKSLKYSPLYNKLLNGIGPRYCPSLEDKIYKFYNKESHQIFLEPEGKNTNEIYPNGISTSLPYKKQLEIIKSIDGLRNAEIIKPGYGVEYDFFNPNNLKKSLESKIIKGLFMAGQINGTTGYEEAGAQGLVAGINAYLYIKNKKQWYPKKNNSYIGVMINDLTKNGITEPYRIFTSRAENRLYIRDDNVIFRLIKIIKKLKTINIRRLNIILYKKYLIKSELVIKKKNKIKTNNNKNIKKEENLLLQIEIKKIINIYLKYYGYLKSKTKIIKKIKFNKKLKLNKNINYFKIKGLSNEVSEKLNKYKPSNINQAYKLPGITFSVIILLINNLKNKQF